jgi:hypothetical protein
MRKNRENLEEKLGKTVKKVEKRRKLRFCCFQKRGQKWSENSRYFEVKKDQKLYHASENKGQV